MCKKLKFENRWVVSDLLGRKRGMLVAWREHVNIQRIRQNDLCMELQVESDHEKETFWTVFVHASTDTKERPEKWEGLRVRRLTWGEKWVIGGGFNDIKGRGEEGMKEKTRKQIFKF